MIKRLAMDLLYKASRENIEAEDIARLMQIFGDKYTGSVRRRDNKGVLFTNKETNNTFKIELDRITKVENNIITKDLGEFCDTLDEVIKLINISEIQKVEINIDVHVDNDDDVNSVIVNNVINPTFMERLKDTSDVFATGIRLVSKEKMVVYDARIEPLFSNERKFYIGLSIFSKEEVNTQNIKELLVNIPEQIEKYVSVIKGV